MGDLLLVKSTNFVLDVLIFKPTDWHQEDIQSRDAWALVCNAIMCCGEEEDSKELTKSSAYA